jgi:ribulose-5-phosphate 4-epimerase/fuculose-1-phosphate aldolase
MARPDAACVIHTHSLAGMAVSAMKVGLLPLAQSAMRFIYIGYHEFEGPAVHLEERERLVNRARGILDAIELRERRAVRQQQYLQQQQQQYYDYGTFDYARGQQQQQRRHCQLFRQRRRRCCAGGCT